MRQKRTLLTLEERLERIARSKAGSPEAAAAKVAELGRISPAALLYKGDVDRLFNLTGEFWEIAWNGEMHYADFTGIFRELFLTEMNYRLVVWQAEQGLESSEKLEPEGLTFGVPLGNALILLALVFIDRAKKPDKKKQTPVQEKKLYDCLQLTLEDYLNALIDLSVRKGDAKRVGSWQNFKESLLGTKDGGAGYDGEMPFAKALADIVGEYMEGWQEFDHIDHIIRCSNALTVYLEEQKADDAEDWYYGDEENPFVGAEDNIRTAGGMLKNAWYDREMERICREDKGRKYLDPQGYYFAEAYEYLDWLPEIYGDHVPPETVREQIFFSDRDYSESVLRSIAEEAPTKELRELLEKYSTKKRLDAAVQKVNGALSKLYMLLVEPYYDMRE